MAEVHFDSQRVEEDNTRYLPSHQGLFIPVRTPHLHDNHLPLLQPASTIAPFACSSWDIGRSVVQRAGNFFMQTIIKMGNGILYRWEVGREADPVVLTQIS